MKPIRKPRYFLVGGNGEVVEQPIEENHKVLPKISDEGIDRLYNKLIVTDPNHAAFPGTKREYVKAMYLRLSSFLFTQSSLLPESMSGKLEGGNDTDEESSDDEREKLAMNMTHNLIGLDDLMDIKDKKKLKLNILHATTKNEAEEVDRKLDEIFHEQLDTVSEEDINRVIRVWTEYSNQLRSAILKGNIDSKMALELAEKTLLITLYPLATNFESINGIPTQQRRVFYGLMQHSQFLSEEQAKVGEYLIRSDERLMKKYKFKNDIYNEATFIFNQKLLDSDIMDLQQIEEGKIDSLGEIKTFDQTDLSVKIQYTKALLVVHAMKSGSYIKDEKGNEIKFSSKFKKKRIIPIFMNGVDTDLMKRTDVSSRNAIPITKVYDLREAVNKFKLIKRKKDDGTETNLYDELASLNVSEYFKVNKYGRISTTGETDYKKIFDNYSQAQRKAGNLTYSGNVITFKQLDEINNIKRSDQHTLNKDKAKPKTTYKQNEYTEYHTTHRLPREGEPGFRIYSTKNIQPPDPSKEGDYVWLRNSTELAKKDIPIEDFYRQYTVSYKDVGRCTKDASDAKKVSAQGQLVKQAEFNKLTNNIFVLPELTGENTGSLKNIYKTATNDNTKNITNIAKKKYSEWLRYALPEVYDNKNYKPKSFPEWLKEKSKDIEL